MQLREEFNIDIRVLGIADSKHMLTSEGGIDLANWRQQWESNKQPSDLQVRPEADSAPKMGCIARCGTTRVTTSCGS